MVTICSLDTQTCRKRILEFPFIDDDFCQIYDILYRMNYNDITYNEFVNIHIGKYGLEKVKRI